ncbi:hypothetical protein PLESTF_001601300 [Pleodorina starrii]|nr:hypothetical protein PLESTF_001601300 [Pleodorina starrii]
MQPTAVLVVVDVARLYDKAKGPVQPQLEGARRWERGFLTGDDPGEDALGLTQAGKRGGRGLALNGKDPQAGEPRRKLHLDGGRRGADGPAHREEAAG